MEAQTSIDKRLLQAVHQGRFELYRLCGTDSPLANAAFQEEAECILCSSGSDYPITNGVLETNSAREISEAEADRVIEFFAARKIPFTWWSGSKFLEKRGFQFAGTFRGIATDISSTIFHQPTIAPQIRVGAAQSEEEARRFLELLGAVFEMGGHITEQFAELNTRLMLLQKAAHLVAYYNDIPVGMITVITSGSIAGIWNLATAAEYRRMGIGATLVHSAIIEAQQRGCGTAMAILTQEAMAAGIFSRFGFKDVCLDF